MRRSGLILLSVSAVAAALVVAPAAGAAAAPVPTAPYTAVSLAASSDGNQGGASTAVGTDLVAAPTATDATVRVTTATSPQLDVTVNAPSGQVFTAGDVYTVAATASATRATVAVGIAGRGCFFASSGSVQVLEATVEGGSLSTFAADLDLMCGTTRFVGAVRLGSSIGFTGATVPTNLVQIGDVALGAYRDQPVTLTATGTDDLPYITEVTFGGPAPEAFSVVGNDCKDRALPAGSSCTVTVRARPLAAGSVRANLVFVNDAGLPYEVPLSASATETATGTYHAVSPRRILDTRSGLGGRSGPLGPNGVVHLGVTGGLPGPAAAVVLNLTVDRPAAAGYLTAFPSGSDKPLASSINFPAGAVVANLVTVPVGAGGKIDIVNYSGSTSVVADLVGWYSSAVNATSVARGGGYHPKNVERLFDSRDGFGKLPPNQYVTLGVYYNGDQRDIAAMSTNITAVDPLAQGYLTAWDGGPSIPSTSTLNFRAGAGVVSNAAIVPTSYGYPGCPQCTQFSVINRSAKALDIVVDITGFFDQGDLTADVRYQPLLSPTRIVDTRSSLGTTTLGTNTTRTVTTPATVAGYDTIALDANLTAVAPTNQTYVTVWPTFDDYPRPVASTLNPTARQTVANHAIAEVGFGNRFNLYNFLGATNLLVDVSGTFELFPPTPADQIPRPGPGPEPAAKVLAGGSQHATATRATLHTA